MKRMIKNVTIVHKLCVSNARVIVESNLLGGGYYHGVPDNCIVDCLHRVHFSASSLFHNVLFWFVCLSFSVFSVVADICIYQIIIDACCQSA